MSIFGTASKGSGGHVSSAVTQAASAVNTQAGDLLVVGVAWNASVVGTASVSDSAGNTYTTSGGITSQSHSRQQTFYCLSATNASASNVITASIAGSGGMAFMCAYCWSIPLSGSCVLDVEADGASSGLSNAPVTSAFNTTGTDEIVLVMAANDFSGISYTAGTGYTLDSASFGSGLGGSEHQLFTSAQSGITAGLGESSSTDWTIRAIAFKAGSGGGGGGGSSKFVQVICWFD